MSSYLARIANRTKGINKANAVLPVSQSWPPPVKPDNSNPFEGEVGPAPVNPVEGTISPTQTTQVLPGTHTIPGTIIDRQAGLKHSSSHTVIVKGEKNESLQPPKREKVQNQIQITPVKPAMAGPVKPGVVEPVKAGVVEPVKAGVAEPVLKNSGKKEENMFETGDETPINPDSTTKRIIHSQVFTQRIERMDNKKSMEEPVPREPDKPALKTVRQSTLESAVSDLSPTGPKDSNSKPITGSVNVPVPELRPVSANANNAAIFTPLKKENKGPRLVIGRIKVEVVTPQPVKTQPTLVRTVSKVKESHQTGNSKGFHSKMQFGLGQI